jgi:hypothetical protein
METFLKPFLIDEIVFGKTYLIVELWSVPNIVIKVREIAFIKELQEDYIGRRALVIIDGKEETRYLSSLGVLPQHSNHYRVFENTPYIRKTLSFYRYDPLHYLMSLGFTKDAAFEELLKLENARRLR